MHEKSAADANIDGMTVNERLYHFNLFPAFDAAVRARSIKEIVGVLMQAKFSEAQASKIAQVLLTNPSKYGF